MSDQMLNYLKNAVLQQIVQLSRITCVVRRLLNKIFPSSRNGKYGPANWPVRSTEFTTVDFFLCAFVKKHIYSVLFEFTLTETNN